MIPFADGFYRKDAQLDHLLHEFLFEKDPLCRLSSRRPLRLFVENLDVAGVTEPAIPERLKPYFKGSNLPNKP